MLSHFVTLPPCYHPISSIPYGTDLCRYAGRSLEYPGTITGAPGQLNHSANQLRGHLPKDQTYLISPAETLCNASSFVLFSSSPAICVGVSLSWRASAVKIFQNKILPLFFLWDVVCGFYSRTSFVVQSLSLCQDRTGIQPGGYTLRRADGWPFLPYRHYNHRSRGRL